MDVSAYIEDRRAAVERALESLLPVPAGPAGRLREAMRYAVFGGGKRLRPVLAIACGEAFGAAGGTAVEPAAALELVHTYSLIHDDLPAMDDDDLRRGRPTTHRAFDEATAILAGDALLTLAFEVLATRPAAAPPERRAAAVAVVARGAGEAGMVGGQIADLAAEHAPPDRAVLEWIHLHKTGALLSASAELGALHGGADGEDRAAMARYGASLGLAFQIADDVLDETASAATLGKTPGKDHAAGKLTYPALVGLDASRLEARRQVEAACAAIPASVRDRSVLESLARFAVERTH